MFRLKDNIQTNIDAIQSLYLTAKVLGILPFNLKDGSNSKCRFLYPLAVIAVFLAISVFGACGKLQLGNIQETTVQFIDIGSDLALTVANFVAVIGINIMKGSDLCKFLANIRRVDQEFRCIKSDFRFPCLTFIIELVLYHVLFLVYYSYNIYIWTTSIGFNIYKHFIIRDMQYYHTIILTLLLRYYALAIKFRFEILNRILENINKPHEDGVGTMMIIDAGSTNLPETASWNMRKIMQIYTKLSLIVEEYNSIFGWQYVILYIVIVINFLMPLNMALVYGSGEKMMYGAKFGVEFIFLCLIWCCIPISMARALFTAGEQGSAEASNTANICYTIVYELSNGEKDQTLKEELLELAQQSSTKPPQFSAAGFFNIDYSILFSLVGSISSYLIVLIQFNK